MADNVYAVFHSESFVDLSLYQFGYEECEPLHSFGPATRNHFLFHYVLEGKGTLMSTEENGTTNIYHLEAGQGFLIWPRQRNTYTADEKDPWVYTWLEFDGLKARELIAQSGLIFDYPIYISHNEEARVAMAAEMLHIVQHKDNPPLELMGHFYLFMNHLLASSSLKKKVAGGKLKDFYIREAIAFIEQNYQRDITVEDMADFCNLNRSYLGKIFRSVMDMAPQEFLIQYRLNKACELLKVTEKPIGEISGMVGYANQLHFSRAFKNRFGMGPRDWRNENRLRGPNG